MIVEYRELFLANEIENSTCWIVKKVLYSPNRTPRLTVTSMFKISMWDIKEPTHYLKRGGREVPGVVAVLLCSKCGPLGVKMFLKRLVVYEATYAKTATSQNGTLPSARECKCKYILKYF